MSHESNSLSAAREFNELYRATQGDQSSHAPANTSLNSVKNNPDPPSPDRRAIKHSDFFVDEVVKSLVVDDNELERSQLTRVSVQFIGAKQGFIDEIRCNPNNFTWSVPDQYKHLIRVYTPSAVDGETETHSDPNDWGESGEDEYGAFQVLVKNIAPCIPYDPDLRDDNGAYISKRDQGVEAVIQCRFKDDFNETIGHSKGYDHDLTATIICLPQDVRCTLHPIKNGNNPQATRAYDNELEYNHDGTKGQNYLNYTSGSDPSKRVMKRYYQLGLDSCDDLLIRGLLNGNQYHLDMIHSVSTQWQKKNEETNEWFDVDTTSGGAGAATKTSQFISTHNPEGNVGQLDSWMKGGGDKFAQPHLNVQGTFGGGWYRAKVSITGDTEDPFTCVITSSETQLHIVTRIPPFTVSGEGYGCAGSPVKITINPTKVDRAIANDSVSNISIRYMLYRVTDASVFTSIGTTTRDNDGASFTWTVDDPDNESGYYSVCAIMVPKDSPNYLPGDTFTNSYGWRWNSPRVATGIDRVTDGTWPQWFTQAGIQKRSLPPIETPTLTGQPQNMSASRALWTWSAVPNPAGGTLTYQVRLIHHAQNGSWTERTPWTDIGSNRGYSVGVPENLRTNWTSGENDHALESPNEGQPHASTQLQVKAKIVPPTTGLTGGDTVAGCYGGVDTNTIASKRCSDVVPTMPVPVIEVASNIEGNDKPILSIDYGSGADNTKFNPPFPDAVTRANFVNISVKPTGASDSAYSDYTQTIASSKGITGSENFATIDGHQCANFGSNEIIATNYTFGKGKTIRFIVYTRWSDKTATDGKECYSLQRAATISTVQANAVWSYSGTKPTSYNYGSHYGITRPSTSRPMIVTGNAKTLNSSTQADLTRYATGVGCDMVPDFRVTRVSEQDAMISLNYEGAGVDIEQINQYNMGGQARWPGVSLQLINSTHPHGATTISNFGNINPTHGSVRKMSTQVSLPPPWVLYTQVSSPGRSYNGKQLVTNAIERQTISWSDRLGTRTLNGAYNQNISGVTRTISQRTDWGPVVRSTARPSYTDYYNLSWEYTIQNGVGEVVDPTSVGASSVVFELSKNADMSNPVQTHPRTLSAAGLSSTSRTAIFLFKNLDPCTEYYTRMRIIKPGKEILESHFEISQSGTNPCSQFSATRSAADTVKVKTTPNTNVTASIQRWKYTVGGSGPAATLPWKLNGLVRPIADDQYGNKWLAVGEGRSVGCGSNDTGSGKLFFDTGFLKYGNVRYQQGSEVHGKGWNSSYVNNIYAAGVPAEFSLMANAIKYCSSNRRNPTKKVLYINDTRGNAGRSYPTQYFNVTLNGICQSVGYSMSYLSGITGDQSNVLYYGALPSGYSSWRSYFSQFDTIMYFGVNYSSWGNLHGSNPNTSNLQGSLLFSLLDAIDLDSTGLIVVTDHNTFQYNANQIVRHYGIQFTGKLDRTNNHPDYRVSHILSQTKYIRNGYHPLFENISPDSFITASRSEGLISYAGGDEPRGETKNTVSDVNGDATITFNWHHYNSYPNIGGKIVVKDANDCGAILL